MDSDRFKQIIKYSLDNQTNMNSKINNFYSRANMNSDRELLKVMQIARPLFEQKGFIIVEMPFSDKEIGAVCYKGDALGYVFLNSSLPKVNVNFALCHEMYHVFYQQTEFNQRVELLNEHYFEYEDEFAANLFAGMLLMPEQSFKSMYEKFCNEKKDNDGYIEVLVKLMNYFETPYMATLIRCYELQLLESGDILQNLIQVNNEDIRHKFQDLWLDEDILNATMRDDYDNLEKLVRVMGQKFQQEEYINERTVNKVIQNMRVLHDKIKGE